MITGQEKFSLTKRDKKNRKAQIIKETTDKFDSVI